MHPKKPKFKNHLKNSSLDFLMVMLGFATALTDLMLIDKFTR